MIRSFRSKETEVLFADSEVPRFRAFERIARRKLLYLHRARSLQDLMVPPGNRLEALRGDRKVNIVFELMLSGAFASYGKMATLTTSRSLTIIEES